MGPYDPLFDRDHDGKLDFFEDFERQDFEDMIAKRGIYEEHEEDEDDTFDDELTIAGLSRDELALMDDDERAETLEETGTDPDYWDD